MQRALARAARAIFPSLLETRSSARLAFERELASTRRFRIENLELRLIKNRAGNFPKDFRSREWEFPENQFGNSREFPGT